MTLCIIHRTETGGVGVVHPAPASRLEDETEGAWLERVKVRAVPEGAPTAVIDTSALPDRASRARWRWSNGTIAVEAESLDAVRLDAETKIDAEFARLADVNPAVVRVRALKREEAEEWLAAVADGSVPDLSGFAALAASAVAMGITYDVPADALSEAARRIVAMAETEDNRLATLDLRRLQAKGFVRSATSPDAVRHVLASLTWT